MKKKIYAIIPARYAASRFPAKLMQPLGSKPVICHTYDAALTSGLFNEVIVATDSDIIFNEIIRHGGKAIMSRRTHESGTDRIAEAADQLDADIVVNIQGDEPFIQKEPLEAVLRLFENDAVQIGSLMRRFKTTENVSDPNYVKVVTDKNNKALYFSRSAIPFRRDASIDLPHYLHIGIYAFTKEALLKCTSFKQAALEQAEKLEQLRFLYNGMNIYMAETDYETVAIDTPEDLENALKHLNKK